jgi:hypothetical protein
MALHELEERGLIKGGRGQVRILDREGLRSQTNGAYTPADEAMRVRAS